MCAMVAAVVLAAGASSRFGSPKQRLLLRPVLERLRNARSVDEIVVVVGAHEVETDAWVVRCAEWERGPGASLRCGLAELAPNAEAEAIDRVVEAWRKRAGDVVAASYGGNRGHPVVLGRRVWAQIPDEGARALEPALVPCDDLGPPGDVDTPADLAGRARDAGAE